ncbi:MAG TPA: 6,7-dimethyl-8-ribityllumazine synthase [Pseudogracilibacillus sp.]|nr:6,7-dimethyl-8-ribityllumazine synthase [Pseudogracilibacillus sp.]
MVQTYVGKLTGEDLTIGIVVSRFNEFITNKLKEGTVQTLKRHHVAEENIHLVEVPGAFEIPLVARKLAEKERIDVVIALGAIIRGETPHFDYVANEVASGINRVSLDCKKPVIFGVLTTDTVEQALERVGVKVNNKGTEAATVAIEMANLLKEL